MAPASGCAAWWRRVLERAVTPERALQGQAEAKRGWERRAQWGYSAPKAQRLLECWELGSAPEGAGMGRVLAEGVPWAAWGK